MAGNEILQKLYELLNVGGTLLPIGGGSIPTAVARTGAPVESLIPQAEQVQPATRWANAALGSTAAASPYGDVSLWKMAQNTYPDIGPYSDTKLWTLLQGGRRYGGKNAGANGAETQTMDDRLSELLALLGYGGDGGADDALGWATLEQRKQEFAQSLAQEAAMQAAALAEQRRQAGLAAGQAIASMQNQAWANALPYALPTNTEFVPGYEPGGPMATLARMGGATYTPPRATPYPQPTAAEMQEWLAEAIKRFG